MASSAKSNGIITLFHYLIQHSYDAMISMPHPHSFVLKLKLEDNKSSVAFSACEFIHEQPFNQPWQEDHTENESWTLQNQPVQVHTSSHTLEDAWRPLSGRNRTPRSAASHSVATPAR
jgi:hypothetical protein